VPVRFFDVLLFGYVSVMKRDGDWPLWSRHPMMRLLLYLVIPLSSFQNGSQVEVFWHRLCLTYQPF